MTRQNALRLFLLALLLLLICPLSCVTPEPPPPGTPDYTRRLAPGEQALELIRDPAQYPNFAIAFRDTRPLLEAVNESLAYMAKPSSRGHFPMQGISHERARRSLEVFKSDLTGSSSPEDFADRISRHFDVYRSVGCDGRGTVLYTGYCEPIINASLERTERFRYPLYRLPHDLIKDADGTTLGRKTAAGVPLPYYTRKEIDGDGALTGRGFELAWLENRLDAHIVHVQGSASLRLPDGSMLKVGYAGNNGKPYSSPGLALVMDGRLKQEEVSLDRIRSFFAEHPDDLDHYLFKNDRYVFFTESEGGPFGSIGSKVTAYRTIATDKSVFPRASVTFLDTALPVRDGRGGARTVPYKGFALDQDTGGAIRSAGRVDIFLGTGSVAEFLAGRTRTEGKLYYLFARAGGFVD